MKKRFKELFEGNLYPEKCYNLDMGMNMAKIGEILKKQLAITGEVICFNNGKKCLEVKIGPNITAEMPWSESTCSNFTYYDDCSNGIPKEIYGLVKKCRIRVKIIDIADGKIIVSRKRNMIEAKEKMKKQIVLNNIIYGRISTACKIGLFIDIGEGITAFCPIRYVSKAYISNMYNFFHSDSFVKVKIIEFENDKIIVSRRDAVVSDYNKYKPNDVITVKIGTTLYDNNRQITGYFAEIEPDVSGIVNISELPYAAITDNGVKEGEYHDSIVEKILPDERKMFLKLIL